MAQTITDGVGSDWLGNVGRRACVVRNLATTQCLSTDFEKRTESGFEGEVVWGEREMGGMEEGI